MCIRVRQNFPVYPVSFWVAPFEAAFHGFCCSLEVSVFLVAASEGNTITFSGGLYVVFLTPDTFYKQDYS